MVLIERERFLNYWDEKKSGIYREFDDGCGGIVVRGGPMQNPEEVYWLLKRIEENIDEFGPIRTILELGVAHGGGCKIWEQVLLRRKGIESSDPKELLYIGIDFKPEPLWDTTASPIDIRLISGDTHNIATRDIVKQILEDKGREKGGGGEMRKVDFLFIDAQHLSIDVEKDLVDYGGFLGDNRIIAFHDTRLCRSWWDRFTGGMIDATNDPNSPTGYNFQESMIFKKEEFKNSLGTGIFYKLPNQNVITFKDI